VGCRTLRTPPHLRLEPGPRDCVVIDIIARAGLPIDIFTLDTGLLFPETYALKERIERRYGVSIRAVTPEWSVPQQAERDGPELWLREPDRCLRDAKGAAAAQRAFRSSMRGSQPSAAIRRPSAPPRRWSDGTAAFGLVKVNPLVRWTFDEGQGLRQPARRPVQPAARTRLSEHRLHAVHQPREARRRPQVRPVAGTGENRVRAPHQT